MSKIFEGPFSTLGNFGFCLLEKDNDYFGAILLKNCAPEVQKAIHDTVYDHPLDEEFSTMNEAEKEEVKTSFKRIRRPSKAEKKSELNMTPEINEVGETAKESEKLYQQSTIDSNESPRDNNTFCATEPASGKIMNNMTHGGFCKT